ncbi:hypothetical protein TNCV_2168481 [Trichonephila clavipes]|nr:hypothetical protein TNCV_2168481 [Trichonephila clavipes]
MGTINHLRTWGHKPRLNGENRDNSRPREDGELNESSGQTNVWIRSIVCGFGARSINGPYFFKNKASQVVNVTDARYRDIITQFSIHKLDDIDVDDLWLQKGATCRTYSQRNNLITGFVKWAQNEIAVVPDFHKRILFSDEAHFWLNGYVNKQNCRIWREANPQVYVETPLHPETLTVWCALWAGGIFLQKR